MAVVEQGARRCGEVQAALSALVQVDFPARLALGGDRVDLGTFAGEAAYPVRPASHYQIGQSHIFRGERFGDLKEIHGSTRY